jgi:hypothetical protein
VETIHEPKAQQFGWASGLALTVVGGLLASLLFALVVNTEQISLRSGHTFLDKYYMQVLKENKRRDAWKNLLSESWQDTHGFKKMNEFFSKLDDIQIGDVSKQPDNAFEAEVTYVDEDGSRSEKLLFRLHCQFWIEKSPLHECSPEDLLIDEVETVDQ